MLCASILVDLRFGRGPQEWVPGAPSDGLSIEDDTEAGSAARLGSAATTAARANPGFGLQLPGGNRARAQDRCRNRCQECVLDDLLTHDRSPFIASHFNQKPDEFFTHVRSLECNMKSVKGLFERIVTEKFCHAACRAGF